MRPRNFKIILNKDPRLGDCTWNTCLIVRVVTSFSGQYAMFD